MSRRWAPAACAAALVLVSGCGTGHSSPMAGAATQQSTASKPLQARISVGRYKLYLDCTGQGSPTVILEAGYGDDHTTWSHVQPGVATFARVCSYDRAGLGKSDPRPGNTVVGARELAQTLHTLLVNAHVPGPYVLVGHSLGGPIVRLYAYQYRAQVAGMVLVDSVVEGWCAASYYAGCPSPTIDRFSFPQSLNELVQATHGRLAGSLGDMPLVVLSRGLRAAGLSPGYFQAWTRLQQKLPALSSHSLRVIAGKSYHPIQKDQPGLVIEAIRVVVSAVRSKGHALPACGKQFEQRGGRCVSSSSSRKG